MIYCKWDIYESYNVHSYFMSFWFKLSNWVKPVCKSIIYVGFYVCQGNNQSYFYTVYPNRWNIVNKISMIHTLFTIKSWIFGSKLAIEWSLFVKVSLISDSVFVE